MARGKKAKTTRITGKHERFAHEYVVDHNATKAAERAGYSPATARQQGQRLLSNAAIADLVAQLDAAKFKQLTITAERVLEELAIVGFSDIGDVVTTNDTGDVFIRRLDGLEPRVRRSIESITQTVTESVDRDGSRKLEKTKTTIKMHSKVAGLRMLADHLGLDAPKKNEHTGKDGKPIQTENKHEHRPAKGLSKDVARMMALKVLGVPLDKLPASLAESKPANDISNGAEPSSGTA